MWSKPEVYCLLKNETKRSVVIVLSMLGLKGSGISVFLDEYWNNLNYLNVTLRKPFFT